MNTIEPRIPRVSVIASALSDDLRAAVRAARHAGFGGVVIDAPAISAAATSSAGTTATARADANLAELSQTGRRELRHVIASAGQQLVAVRFDPGPRGFGPAADIDRLLARLDQLFRLAADLAAGCALIDLGPLPEPLDPPKPRPSITPEQAGAIIIPGGVEDAKPARSAAPQAAVDPRFIASVDTALAALGEIADRYRLTVAFSSSLAGFAAIERALLAARCPWFGVDLDAVAALGDRWESDEIFSRLGAQIRHVRARDAVLGADRRTRPIEIGRGSVDWPRFLGALESCGYAGWITIDPAELPNARHAAETGLKMLRGS